MYLNVKRTDRKNSSLPLMIQAISIDHNPVSYVSKSGRPNHQWIYCIAGSGYLTAGSEKCTLTPGYGYFMLANTSYSYSQITEDWKIASLEFSGSICDSLLASLDMRSNNSYYFHNQVFFNQYIKKIYEYTRPESCIDDIELSTICYNFLLDLSHYARQVPLRNTLDQSDHHFDVLFQIVEYLENNFEKVVSLDDIALYVGLNKRYMCTLFRSKMNTTIIAELTNIRIGQAGIYLRQFPEKKVTEIAAMCGFDDGSYFGKVFKKKTGLTPEQYRRVSI